MNALLSFMSAFLGEPVKPTALDSDVAEFLGRIPAGDGRIGCLFLWHAFEQQHPEPVSPEEFEDAASRVAKTTDVYGRRYIDGVDSVAAKALFLECFA